MCREEQNAQDGKLTDIQKAKDAYGMHLDKLFWSRVQTLIAVYGATLAGMYALRAVTTLWVPLAVIGFGLVVIVWIFAERDHELRDLSFEQSGIPRTRVPRVVRSIGIFRFAMTLLLVTEFGLAVWILKNSPFTLD